MALHALLSPGGSAGVTTAALALTLTWPRTVILAECDPAGGDVVAGLFGGMLPARAGLLAVAVEAGRGPGHARAVLQGQLVELYGDFTRLLLPGITDPRQAAGLAPAWPMLAATLADQPEDVVADCGRLDASDAWPLPVLAAAATITVVLRPSLRQVARARVRLEMLAQVRGATQPTLLITGPGRYSEREVAKALDVTATGTLPDDPRTAAMLTDSDGAGRHDGLAGRPLMRAAAAIAQELREAAGEPEAGTARAAGAGAVP